jgi:hypothetical protein
MHLEICKDTCSSMIWQRHKYTSMYMSTRAAERDISSGIEMGEREIQSGEIVKIEQYQSALDFGLHLGHLVSTDKLGVV